MFQNHTHTYTHTFLHLRRQNFREVPPSRSPHSHPCQPLVCPAVHWGGSQGSAFSARPTGTGCCSLPMATGRKPPSQRALWWDLMAPKTGCKFYPRGASPCLFPYLHLSMHRAVTLQQRLHLLWRALIERCVAEFP